jgi:hypothetical protein
VKLNDDQRQVLWFNELFDRAIRATPDVSEALVVAQIAFSQSPWPEEGPDPAQYWRQVRQAFDEATAALSLEVPAPEEEPYRRRAVGWAGASAVRTGDFPVEPVTAGQGSGSAANIEPEAKAKAAPKAKGRGGKKGRRVLPKGLRFRLSRRLRDVLKRRKQGEVGPE